MEWKKGKYRLTDKREEVDLDFVESILRTTYWAAGRDRDTIGKSIENSIPFSLFHGSEQVGFARALTDGATFKWIGDLVIEPGYRGRGLGKWVMRCVMEHPEVKDASQMFLRTRDAHGLYESLGFSRDECMVSRKPPSGR